MSWRFPLHYAERLRVTSVIKAIAQACAVSSPGLRDFERYGDLTPICPEPLRYTVIPSGKKP